tara:strand:+ start:773 stop:1273 length:501 start_codon:yes stop_codon:yes gene_type:complete
MSLSNLFLSLSGFFLLYSYYRLSIYTPYVDELWGNIRGNLKKFYIFSIFLCAIPFILTLYYVNSNNNINPLTMQYIYLGLFGIVIFSIFWMPLSLLYILKDEDKKFIKILVLFTLFLVALSSAFVLYQLSHISDNSTLYLLSFYGMSYFLFHVFILDFITWSFFFF